MDPLDLVPSAPHRASARLIAPAAEAGSTDGLRSDLAASRPEEIVEIVAAHHVETVVATAFELQDLRKLVPRDLIVFFSEMQQANRRRHELLRAQLLEIGRAAAGRGLRLVALKGGAELLSPVHRVRGQRYISDLDLLAAETEIDAARDMLHDLGAHEADIAEINIRDHYHLAPFLKEDWPAQVELHRALGPAELFRSLRSCDVLARALPSGHPGLGVPSPADRILHLVLHARKDAGEQHRFRVSLRDVHELQAMRTAFPRKELDAARARLPTQSASAPFSLLEGMACALFTPAGWDDLAPQTRHLAEQALVTFGNPADQRQRETLHWLRHYAHALLADPERRRHYMREFLRPGGLRDWWAFHRDRRRRIR